MTEAEINAKVAAAEGYGAVTAMADGGSVVQCGGEGGIVVYRDYCNSWLDAGPLIVKYGVCLAQLKSGVWLAADRPQGINSKFWREEDEKPLVAVMKVILDIKAREARRAQA